MASNYISNDAFGLSRALNGLALAGVCAILLMAFVWQLAFNELPCPLCLLQRAAFVLIGIALILNLRFGPSSLHYAMVIASAMAGAFASGRQVLLHIAPGDAGYGSPFLGLHFYTWAFIASIAFMVFSCVMLALDRRSADQAIPRRTSRLYGALMWLFLLLVAGNVVSTLLECGFGPCADNPVSYLWLG